MCGRFSLTRGDRDIEEEFGVKVPLTFPPRYNIAPTQEVLVLLDDGERCIEVLRWGLIPSWAKDPKMGQRLINARVETLLERPSFREAFRKRRCLILADGFYEWRIAQGRKIPVYVRLKSKRPFGFAGLWERWTSPEGLAIKTCTIITTEANELLKPIHKRMPAIVPKGLIDLWLDPQSDLKRLSDVLKPYPSEELEAYEVSQLVNSPKNDLQQCVEPLHHSGLRLG